MDFQNEAEKHHFLLSFGPPYKSICNFMTLKTGVILIAAFDIIISLYGLIELISFIFFSDSDEYTLFSYCFKSLLIILDIIALPFALLGLKGINKLSQRSISIYSQFKIAEFFLIAFFKFALITSRKETTTFLTVLFVIFERFIAFFLVKIIWSADIRLKHNETILVMHGEEALKLIQQQAINLSDSSSWSSNIPHYVSPSYSG